MNATITTKALCPTRAKIASALAAEKKAVIEWRPTESGAMRADVRPYGKGWMITWSVAIRLVKADGRPATGTDAAATLMVAVALDPMTGRWESKLTPGQDEGERPLILSGAEGGYPAAQESVASAMADYVTKTIGKRRGYRPAALRSPLGCQDMIALNLS